MTEEELRNYINQQSLQQQTHRRSNKSSASSAQTQTGTTTAHSMQQAQSMAKALASRKAHATRSRANNRRAQEEAGYGDFNATHLFCPKCRTANPVRERLVLYLPDGDLYDYQCQTCGTSVGTRKAGK